MKVRFLGTGSGCPNPNRMTSSILFEGKESALLVDAGEGCARRLEETENWSQEIGTVLITHSHPDHHAGLPMLLRGMFCQKRETPLQLIAAEPFLSGLLEWLEYIRLGESKLPFQLKTKTLPLDDKTKLLSGHILTTRENGHLPQSAGGCYSLLIENGDNSWFCSSDLGDLGKSSKLLKQADSAIIDGIHIDPLSSLEICRKHNVDRIIFTHLDKNRNNFTEKGVYWAEDNLLMESI